MNGALAKVSRDVQLMNLSVYELDETVKMEQAIREDENNNLREEVRKAHLLHIHLWLNSQSFTLYYW